MMIAITSQGKEITSPVDPRFGRAKYFIVLNADTGEFTVHDNAVNLQLAQGAGIQAGQAVVNLGATVVITGNVGPKAFNVLTAGNIQIITGASGTVQQTIDDYKQGKLKAVDQATVEGHWA
jgi:predicted Fe-Mo cluster-binding NifX family protein